MCVRKWIIHHSIKWNNYRHYNHRISRIANYSLLREFVQKTFHSKSSWNHFRIYLHTIARLTSFVECLRDTISCKFVSFLNTNTFMIMLMSEHRTLMIINEHLDSQTISIDSSHNYLTWFSNYKTRIFVKMNSFFSYSIQSHAMWSIKF